MEARPVSEEQPAPTGVPAQAPAEPNFEVPTDGAVTAAAPPSRKAALMRSGLIIGVLVVVFGIILPQFIDYADVIAAFKELTTQQVVVITLLGAFAWLVSGLIFSALIPGLSAIRGTMSWLILGGIGASVPFGPWNMGVLWVVVRGWGVGNAPATSGIALYGVVNELSRLALPLFAIIILAASGELSGATDTGTAWAIAIICAVAFIVVTALIIGIVRSERIADWFGRTGQRIADWVLKRLGRTGSPNVDAAIHKFRDQMGEVIRRRGFASLAIAIVSQVAWILVLTVSLRMVGVPEDVLPFGEIFAVYALVLCITIIPLSPGGAGVTELLMISAFSALAGPQYEAAVAAGVLLYRIYFWFIPIPIAWILLKVVRRGKSMLPTTAELRAYAKGDAAGEAA
jgi:putative heme transporter